MRFLIRGSSRSATYFLFQIDKNDTAIVVEKVGDKGAPYSEFIEELRKAVDGGKECR